MVKRVKPTLQIDSLEVIRNKNFKLIVGDLNLYPGKITGVVGSNGSGKTTLVESVAGLTKFNIGTVLINGQSLVNDNLQVKAHLGYIPDDDEWLIPELTASEYLNLLADIYRQAGVKVNMPLTIKKLSSLLQFTQLKQQLGSLSHGNKKKVQIIAGLMHMPSLIVVDELRNGLDPIAIKVAEDIVKKFARQGSAVLAASHDLWWAERVADEIVMLQQGSIIFRQPTQAIIADSGSVEAKFMELFKVYAT